MRLPEEDRAPLSQLTTEMIMFYGSLPAGQQIAILDFMKGRGQLVVDLLKALFRFAQSAEAPAALEGAPEGAPEGALVAVTGSPPPPSFRLAPDLADLLGRASAVELSAIAALFGRAAGGASEGAVMPLLLEQAQPAVEALPPPQALGPEALPDLAPEGLPEVAPQLPALEAPLQGGPGAEAVELQAEAALFQGAVVQEIRRGEAQGRELAEVFDEHSERVEHLLGNLVQTAEVILGGSREREAAEKLDQIRTQSNDAPERVGQLRDRIGDNLVTLAAAVAAAEQGQMPAEDVGGLVNGIRDAVTELRNVMTEIADGARQMGATAQNMGETDVALNALTIAKEALLEADVLPGPGHALAAPFAMDVEVVGRAKSIKRKFSAVVDRLGQANDLIGGIAVGVVALADVVTAAAAGTTAGFLGAVAAPVIGFVAAGIALFFGVVAIGLAFHRIHRGELSHERLGRIRGDVTTGRGREVRAYASEQKRRKVIKAAEGGLVGVGASMAAVLAIGAGLLLAAGLTGPGAIAVAVVVGIVGLVAAAVSIWAAFFRDAETSMEADVIVSAACTATEAGEAARARIFSHVGYLVGLRDGELVGNKAGKEVGASRIKKDLRGSGSLKAEIRQKRADMATALVDMLIGGGAQEQVDAELILTALGLQPAALRHQATSGSRGDVEAEVAGKLKP